VQNTLVKLESIPGGLETTIRHIKKIIEHDSVQPKVRMFASELIGDIDGRDFQSIAKRIFDFTRENIVYRRDPHHTELLMDLENSLRQGLGDCDDMVIAAGTLLNTLGVPIRLIIAAYNLTGDPIYQHIYLEYLVHGQWLVFDATEANGFNNLLSIPTFTRTEKLTEGQYMNQMIAVQNDNVFNQSLGVDPATAVAAYQAGKSVVNEISSWFGGGSEHKTYGVGELDRQIKPFLEANGIFYHNNLHPTDDLVAMVKKVQMAQVLAAFGIILPKSNRTFKGKKEIWYDYKRKELQADSEPYLKYSNYYEVAGNPLAQIEVYLPDDLSVVASENAVSTPQSEADETTVAANVTLPATIPVNAGSGNTAMYILGGGLLLFAAMKMKG
jgi:hypothetical protein